VAAGSREFLWDGRDDAGSQVGAGVYFARFASPRGSLERRIVILR